MIEKLYEDYTLVGVLPFPPIDIPMPVDKDGLIQSIEENRKKMNELEKAEGVNIRGKEDFMKEEALVHACINGSKDLVVSLLNKGVDLNRRESMFAFFYACTSGRKDIMNLLLEKNLCFGTKNCMIALLHLCNRKDADVDIVKYLLGCGLDLEHKFVASSLFRACRNGRKDIVRTFFDCGFKIYGNYGASVLISVCKERCIDINIVRYLLRKGLDINNICGKRSFFYAYVNGRKDIAKLLIDNGLDIKNEDSAKIFLDACKWFDVDMVKLLIDNGLGINNEYGSEACAFACINENKDIVKILFDGGLKVEVALRGISDENKNFFDKTLCEYLESNISEIKKINYDNKDVRFYSYIDKIKKIQRRILDLVECTDGKGIKLSRFNNKLKVFLSDMSKIMVRLKYVLNLKNSSNLRERLNEYNDYDTSKYIRLEQIARSKDNGIQK